MKAIGIHTFAGGFSMGVQSYFDVDTHLEVHGFGVETAEALCGVKVHNSPASDWPDVPAEFAFGNPRCTGFSCVTCGYDDTIHGPWSAATQDIHDFVDYCTGRYPIFVWESVQQAFTTGRPLLDHLVEKVAKKGYRVAHVFVNAETFGNSQARKRYFFIAYDGSKNFNVSPPDSLPVYKPTLYDAIYHLRNYESPHVDLTALEKHVVPNLPCGWDLNAFAKYDYDNLPDKWKVAYDFRLSDLPFSMHCIQRLAWTTRSPTITSSFGRKIHPCLNRPVTVKEVATIMGWSHVPVPTHPIAAIKEIAKGVCPEVGEWIALQAARYLQDAWGDEDFESTYSDKTDSWEGASCNGKLEKVFNLTRYVQHREREDFPYDDFSKHRFNVDERSGKLIRPWTQVGLKSRNDRPATGLGGPARVDSQHVPNEPSTESGS